MAIKPSFSEYLQSWEAEIQSRANRVRQLIGSAHWLSDGHQKEYIIREFLSRYLPNNLSINRGFICSTRTSHQCSTEIDILITDPSLHPPFFSEGGLAIVPTASVIDTIEVKTTFNKTKLIESLKSQLEIRRLVIDDSGYQKIGTQIFFFNNESSFEKTCKIIAPALKSLTLCSDGNLNKLLKAGPFCISCLGSFVCYITPISEKKYNMKIFETNDLSLAIAISDLFSFISTLNGKADGPTEMDRIIGNLPEKNSFVEEIEK